MSRMENGGENDRIDSRQPTSTAGWLVASHTSPGYHYCSSGLCRVSTSSAMAAKPPCAFGAKCYRKNPQHLANFSHPAADTEPDTKQPSPVNSKAQSEPSSLHSHTPATSKRTAALLDEPDEEKLTVHKPSHTAATTGRLKRAKTNDSHTATTINNRKQATHKPPPHNKRRHIEDPNQSDEEHPPIHPTTSSPHHYQPLSVVNSLTAAERVEYWEGLLMSMYRLSFPEELYTFRSFLIAVHIPRSGCRRCTEDGVLDEGCVEAVMRLLPAVDGVAGMECCGVLDWLCGRFDGCDGRRVKPWLHWRYFYDLPELMTVYRAVTSSEEADSEEEQQQQEEDDEKAVEAAGGGWHCGYWRDAPEDEPPFLVSASNYHPVYTVQGRTIYHAVHRHLLQLLNVSNRQDKGGEHSRLIQATIDQLLKHAASHHIPLTTAAGQPQPPLRDKAYLARQKRVLAPTFTSLGFVCPYNADTQVGFRPLPIDDGKLRAMVERMERERVSKGGRERVGYGEWDGVVTLLSLAMDECDPGTVLLFYQQIYCCEGPDGDGVRVVEGEVSQGMGSGYEMTGGEGRLYGWKRCIGQQMKYRYRRLLSQVDVAKRPLSGGGRD